MRLMQLFSTEYNSVGPKKQPKTMNYLRSFNVGASFFKETNSYLHCLDI